MLLLFGASTVPFLILDKKKKLCMLGLGSFQLDPVFYAPDGQVRLAICYSSLLLLDRNVQHVSILGRWVSFW
jgi:hypothetical protein